MAATRDKAERVVPGTVTCRVYKETWEKIDAYRNCKPIPGFIADAVNDYVKSMKDVTLYDRMAALESEQRKITQAVETSLGLLVNTLSKLNLMDDKKK